MKRITVIVFAIALLSGAPLAQGDPTLPRYGTDFMTTALVVTRVERAGRGEN
jgi:hypothetical protein